MQKSIVIHNLLIRYYEYLSKGSEAIIFLHGWRSEGVIWNDIAMKLNKEKHSVYALDLPGFGGSPAPKVPCTLSDYATIVSEFIKKMNLKNVILVGHSFGGRIAIKLSGTQSPSVYKLVLVDSAGFVDTKKQGIKVFAQFVKPLFTPLFMQGVRKWIYKNMGAEDYLATPELQKTFVHVLEEDLTEDMKNIIIPTLLVWGENDQDTPISFGERMHSLIQHSQLITLSDAGHFSFLDKPEEFYQALIQFIKQ